MPAIAEQTLTVHDLYAMRDRIGLSRSECKQPPRYRSLFEWGKAQRAYYLNNLTGGITSPPKVFIYEPFIDSSKAAVLDGRQRLKAIFSYLDGNYPLGEAAPDGWAGKTYKQLQATIPEDDYGLDYRDPDCNIFTDKEYCDWEVSNLKMGIAHQKRTARIEFRYTGLRVPVPQLPSPDVSKMIAELQIRATEFVTRHHHKGAIPC